MGSARREVDQDVETILDLERRRFAAVVDGDYDSFAAVAHPDLLYTHSSGVTDTLASYLVKCREGFYVYHRVDHPVTKVVVTGDLGLVLGEMNADLTAGGTRKQLRNSSLAVWLRDGEDWKLIAYQPTPLP